MAVFDITFYSNSLNRHTQLTAIIPIDMPEFPGFPKPDKNKLFKSLYLLHGYSGNQSDWLRGTQIEQFAIMHQIAVFCPAGENSFYLDDKARGAMYGEMIGRELIEFTRRIFPLSAETKDTSIGGLSMGGYGAIRNGFKYNDVFGSIIALSSALINDNVAKGFEQENNPMISSGYFMHTFGEPGKIKGSDIDPEALARKLVDSGTARPRLYMACGTEDFLINENRKFHKCLLEMGYEHTYIEAPGMHSWEFWNEYIEKAMVWLTGQDRPQA
ncbi:MAG: alpha/beta hydrolase-fold protein [Bacillota bacterium]|jgi:putative tributyrin esterase|nr:alpha/beta hydrolase-fold protein [Bacillota bacterium]HHU30587.1 acetylesterase [Bacillota bacterium]